MFRLLQHELQQPFLDNIFAQLDQLVDQGRSSTGSKTAVGDSTCKACTRVQRCCRLLGGFIRASTAELTAISHGFASQAHCFAVTIKARRMDNSNTQTPGSTEFRPFPISMRPKETLRVLKRRLAVAVKHPQNKLTLAMLGKYLQGDDKTMKELGVSDASEIVVMFSSAAIKRKSAQTQASIAIAECDHPGDMIAAKEQYYKVCLL